jgi:hypothetical protein
LRLGGHLTATVAPGFAVWQTALSGTSRFTGTRLYGLIRGGTGLRRRIAQIPLLQRVVVSSLRHGQPIPWFGPAAAADYSTLIRSRSDIPVRQPLEHRTLRTNPEELLNIGCPFWRTTRVTVGGSTGSGVAVARSHLDNVERARRRRDKADEELVEAMVKAHLSGETYRDIGDRAGYSHQRTHELVRAWLSRHEQ